MNKFTTKVSENSRGDFKKFTLLPKGKSPNPENILTVKQALLRTEKVKLYGF